MFTDGTSLIINALNRTHPNRHHVTFRYNEDAVSMLDSCSMCIEEHWGYSLSRASIIRLLMDIHDESLSNKDAPKVKVTRLDKTTKAWLEQEIVEKASITITEQHRILLRKLEFEIQKTNWSIPVDRNDTVQLLTMSYGEFLKKNVDSLR